MSTIWIVAIGFALMGAAFFIYCVIYLGDDTQRDERQEYMPKQRHHPEDTFDIIEEESRWRSR
jgi:hypothetical protein